MLKQIKIVQGRNGRELFGKLRPFKRKASLFDIGCCLLLMTQAVFAWGNAGHEAVVAVALQIDPSLRPRVEAILTDLPNSQNWKDLEASGISKPHPVEKQDPDGWVKALATNPEKAATFPDWAR